LPGKNSPEKLFYEYLKSLEKSDSIWGKTGGYTKQVCFKDLSTISNNRVEMKKWFQKQKPHFGRGYSRLFAHWRKAHPEEVERVNKDFVKLIDKITK
jgi:hypothetical protein